MNNRKQRGLEIAAASKITKRPDGSWVVPPQSGPDRYIVRNDDGFSCTCQDHQTRGLDCKHIHAIKEVLRARLSDRQADKIVAKMIERPKQRPTYKQNWTAYNAAQTTEKEYFLDMLCSLCEGIPNRQASFGRPPIPLSDAIFAACFKVFSTVSGRRFMCDLRSAKDNGYITKTPHFNSIFNVLDNADVTAILHNLIVESSLPMKAIEQDFAVDASGFTTSRFIRWYDHKYKAVRQQHEWVKVHLMCGVKTNIVTAVEIAGKDASSTPMLPGLLNTTAKNFKPREVSGDKEFGSLGNYAAIEAVGAMPYIPFKSIHNGKGGGLWAKMYHFFHFQRDEFLAHYHKRSNVESTFSMIKAKFRDHVRSKTDTAMVNEVLCKILCHNICVLIQEMHELGIEPRLGMAI